MNGILSLQPYEVMCAGYSTSPVFFTAAINLRTMRLTFDARVHVEDGTIGGVPKEKCDTGFDACQWNPFRHSHPAGHCWYEDARFEGLNGVYYEKDWQTGQWFRAGQLTPGDIEEVKLRLTQFKRWDKRLSSAPAADHVRLARDRHSTLAYRAALAAQIAAVWSVYPE